MLDHKKNKDAFLSPFSLSLKSLSVAAAVAMGSCGALSEVEAPKMKHIAVTQFMDFKVANQVREGVELGLKERGYEKGKNLQWTYQIAQGNVGTQLQIAKQFYAMKPDVIVAVSTPSAQSLVKSGKGQNVPMVFGSLTAPLESGVVTNLERPGGNVTGTTDYPPLDLQLSKFREILPTAKTMGVIYNAGEANSASLVKILGEKLKDIKLIKRAVTDSREIKQAITSLIPEVDMVYIPLDNVVLTSADLIIQTATDYSIAHKKPIPCVGCDPTIVERGAVFALGFNHVDVGVKTGHMVADVLEGKNPGDIPVSAPDTVKTYVNTEVAQKIGLPIPAAVLENANIVQSGKSKV